MLMDTAVSVSCHKMEHAQLAVKSMLSNDRMAVIYVQERRALCSSYSKLFTVSPDWSPLISARTLLHVMYRLWVSYRVVKRSETGIGMNDVVYDVIRDVAHGLYVTRRSLLAGYRTVSRITHKCNSLYVHRKSVAFHMEIFTDLTNAEWYFWLISKAEFQTDRLNSIRILRAEIRLRPSVRFDCQ